MVIEHHLHAGIPIGADQPFTITAEAHAVLAVAGDRFVFPGAGMEPEVLASQFNLRSLFPVGMHTFYFASPQAISEVNPAIRTESRVIDTQLRILFRKPFEPDLPF